MLHEYIKANVHLKEEDVKAILPIFWLNSSMFFSLIELYQKCCTKSLIYCSEACWNRIFCTICC